MEATKDLAAESSDLQPSTSVSTHKLSTLSSSQPVEQKYCHPAHSRPFSARSPSFISATDSVVKYSPFHQPVTHAFSKVNSSIQSSPPHSAPLTPSPLPPYLPSFPIPLPHPLPPLLSPLIPSLRLFLASLPFLTHKVLCSQISPTLCPHISSTLPSLSDPSIHSTNVLQDVLSPLVASSTHIPQILHQIASTQQDILKIF